MKNFFSKIREIIKKLFKRKIIPKECPCNDELKTIKEEIIECFLPLEDNGWYVGYRLKSKNRSILKGSFYPNRSIEITSNNYQCSEEFLDIEIFLPQLISHKNERDLVRESIKLINHIIRYLSQKGYNISLDESFGSRILWKSTHDGHTHSNNFQFDLDEYIGEEIISDMEDDFISSISDIRILIKITF